MRTYFCSLFLLFFITGTAQFSMEKIITTCNDCTPTDISSGDIDGDGRIDILSSSAENDRISWYKNLGNDRFSSQIVVTTSATYVDAISTANLDGDEKIDIIAVVNRNVVWYKNDGNGAFSESQKITDDVVGSAFDFLVEDVDRDGDMDIIAFQTFNALWFKNDGRGNFSGEVIFTTNSVITDVYGVDFDKDGDFDIVLSLESNNKLVWYKNNGLGIFSEHQISSFANHISSIFCADFDGDKDIDILAGSEENDHLIWYENKGQEIFSEEKFIVSNSSAGKKIALGIDADKDGDMDIIDVFPGSTRGLSWIENDGTGNFLVENGLSPENVISLSSDITSSMQTVDLNGDGNIDIIHCDQVLNIVGWYGNLGNGKFSVNVVSGGASRANVVRSADFDGDGDIDVISASDGDTKVAWYENKNNGEVFEERLIAYSDNAGAELDVADFDGDGDQDVVSAAFSFTKGRISWYENDGTGNFISENIIPSEGNLFRDLYSNDLDNDGDIDILFAAGRFIGWLENDGLGNFSNEQAIGKESWARSIFCIDLNEDGHKDVLFASHEKSKLTWYRNDGNENFTKQIIDDTSPDSKGIFGVDVNMDDKIDVIKFSWGGRLSWYENIGSGNFSTERTIATQVRNITSIYISDLNDDRYVDILASSNWNNKIVWYTNNRNGTFSENIISEQANGALSVHANDLNGDGMIDILSASEFDDKIAWYENIQDYILSLKVFEDSNSNCTKEATEKGLVREVQIQSLPSQTNQFFFSNNDGIIQRRFGATEQDTTIEIRLLDAPNRINTCPTTFLLKRQEQLTISLPIQLASCPTLSVDVGTSFLRRCFDNTYSVNYCNNSREDIDNGRIEIQMDSFFTVITSDLVYENLGADLYEFSLPKVESGNCGDFHFTINLSCDAFLGQTHCVEAYAYPDTCQVLDLNWSGASLKIAGTCVQDEAKFTISNEGQGDMFKNQTLIVVEDQTIIKEKEINLVQGDIETIFLPANGATYHAFINQVPNHPGRSTPIAYIEGCGGINTTGLINAFPKDDNDRFKAIDCQANVGSYDPNDKVATPVGLETGYYLEKNTDIAYKIRFQNTGTDTAFNIVIWDTLSAYLNAATIEAGTSSHPYQFDRFQDTIAGLDRIRFTFTDIMLPDSNINEAASHGFVQFRIQQHADLIDGTVIENKAAIYFDFNEPIFTNVVHHTIGFPLTRLTVSTIEEKLSKEIVRIIPNPFENFINVEQVHPSSDRFFSIFDMTGKEVKTIKLYTSTQQIATANLGKGLYYYQIVSGAGELIGNGKIIKQ